MDQGSCEALSESIGRVMALLSKQEIEAHTKQYIGKGNDKLNFKLSLCIASHYIFDKRVNIMEYKDYLDFIKNSTMDTNHIVREKAWAALDAAYYHWPSIRKVLNSDFYKSMAKQMLKDPSLIKEDK